MPDKTYMPPRDAESSTSSKPSRGKRKRPAGRRGAAEWLIVGVGILLLVAVVYYGWILYSRPLSWTIGKELPPDFQTLSFKTNDKYLAGLVWLSVWYPVGESERTAREEIEKHGVKLRLSDGSEEWPYRSDLRPDEGYVRILFRVNPEKAAAGTMQLQYGENSVIELKGAYRSLLH